MRESQTSKMPITIIIGDKELENNTISFRKFGNTETITKTYDEFINELLETINSKKYNIE